MEQLIEVKVTFESGENKVQCEIKYDASENKMEIGIKSLTEKSLTEMEDENCSALGMATRFFQFLEGK